jgi:hypothetical protein
VGCLAHSHLFARSADLDAALLLVLVQLGRCAGSLLVILDKEREREMGFRSIGYSMQWALGPGGRAGSTVMSQREEGGPWRCPPYYKDF